jgi:hypothetical protein
VAFFLKKESHRLMLARAHLLKKRSAIRVEHFPNTRAVAKYVQSSFSFGKKPLDSINFLYTYSEML